MCMKTKKKNSIYVSVGVCATIAAAETFLGNGMWLVRAHRTDGRARSWCDTRSIASLPRTIPKRITFLWDWNKGTRSIFSSLFFFLFVSRALQTHGSILMTEVRRQKKKTRKNSWLFVPWPVCSPPSYASYHPDAGALQPNKNIQLLLGNNFFIIVLLLVLFRDLMTGVDTHGFS